jgi:hypothetical protein
MYNYRTAQGEIKTVKVKRKIPYKEIGFVLLGGFIGLTVVTVSFKGG